MEARDNFTDQFAKAARRQEDTSAAFPSMEQIWNKVEARLDAEQQPEEKQKRLSPFWKKGIAAAVLLLAGIGLVYIVSRPGDKPQEPSYTGNSQKSGPSPGNTTAPSADTLPERGKTIARQDAPPVPADKKPLRQTAVAEASKTSTSLNLADRTRRRSAAQVQRTAAAMAVADRGPRSISGQVLDEKGEGVPGASVKIKGTEMGTVSDLDGFYSLEVPAGKNILLVQSMVGDTVIDLSAINGPVVVRMSQEPIDLKGVQIYGKIVCKRESVSSISKVTAEQMISRPVTTDQIASRPVTDIVKALDGNAAGVNISAGSRKQQRRQEKPALNEKPGHMTLQDASSAVAVSSGGGQPGASPDIAVRGFGSLSASNSPLIVVDGKLYEGSLKDIDPHTVASLSVLKDASATALYGARGANGVIMITTKKNAEIQKGMTGKHRSFFGRTWYKVKKVFKGKKN